MRQEQSHCKQLRDITVLGIPLTILLWFIYQWSYLANWMGQRDHVGMFLNATQTYGLDFWLGKVSILGKGSFGSAAMLHWIIYLPFFVLGIYFIQVFLHWNGRKLDRHYVWSNTFWLIITFMVMFTAIGIAAYAHYNDLYTCRPPLCTSPMETRVDDLTHFWTVAMIASALCNINWMDLLGWHRRIGRLKEALLQLTVPEIIMWFWEVGEFGNPAAYANPPWNSLSDIFWGTIAALFMILAYNAVVPFEE